MVHGHPVLTVKPAAATVGGESDGGELAACDRTVQRCIATVGGESDGGELAVCDRTVQWCIATDTAVSATPVRR
jgi:hypothetical protein